MIVLGNLTGFRNLTGFFKEITTYLVLLSVLCEQKIRRELIPA
jgi:hypothetical protein